MERLRLERVDPVLTYPHQPKPLVDRDSTKNDDVAYCLTTANRIIAPPYQRGASATNTDPDEDGSYKGALHSDAAPNQFT